MYEDKHEMGPLSVVGLGESRVQSKLDLGGMGFIPGMQPDARHVPSLLWHKWFNDASLSEDKWNFS